MISYVICLLFINLFLGCNKDETPTGPQFNSLKEEIDNLANQYVKVGAIIGVINKQQKKLIFSYGKKYINDNTPPDANTVFDTPPWLNVLKERFKNTDLGYILLEDKGDPLLCMGATILDVKFVRVCCSNFSGFP